MIRNLILLVAALIVCANTNAQKSSKPNVIIINMDDMGYGDTEPYGMTGVSTDNFNRVAKEGTRFTHFNAAQAVCTTSRAALLTGTYPNRLGLAGALLPGSKVALNPEEETIASLLKEAGYKTAMLGKWHLGNKPPYTPIHYGFDSFYGIPYSHDIWPIDYAGKRITDPANMRGGWPALPVYQGDVVVDSILTLQGQSRLTTAFTERAVAFIKENKAKPFFLYLAHPMPHVPLAASDKFRGKSKIGLFGDVILELDWSLGEVLKVLDQEKIADNTLLIVTSDNGPWLNFGDNAGSSGGFKEGKSTSWEGGTRVPMLVRWPGKVEAAGVNSQLMTNMDLLPTIMAATGAPLPEKKIDGMNFLPVLLGKADEGPREVLYYYFGKNNLEAIRYRNWKLVLPHPSNTYAALHGKEGTPGKIARVQVPTALYNLSHDAGEDYDVQELYPEVVAQIMLLAEEARKDLGDDLTNRVGENVRKPAMLQ
ncbi:arylsulfatase [Pontibacter diazotrophicus]|uniref:Arylsulfatase n=1 Tax=Pontibacter diazotrophicus TaxID=1400979 RepID=A0A3D8LIF5_9BACT|nr:sulfatase [Pontibacter diazotrophicus]RDV17229.1 arylsulfatase [Pontibacter diazotrophicus]